MSHNQPRIPPVPALNLLARVRDRLIGIHRRTMLPSVVMLEIMQAGLLAQALGATAELGVADALAHGPLTADELARRLGVRPDALVRLLRPLVAEGMFTHHRDTYALTALGDPLRSDAVNSIRSGVRMFGDPRHRAMWSQLAQAVRTGTTGAESVHGAPIFEYARRQPCFGALIDAAMTDFSELAVAPILAAYDFARYDTIVDIGGGKGRLLSEILIRTPRSRGVLFDTAEVLADVPARLAALGLDDRCRVRSGCFFEAVPEGGDAYILKHVIHDWLDPQAAQLLSTVRAAIPSSGRLLLIEVVLPKNTRRTMGNLLDLEMLVVTGGRERTAPEYRKLLSASGFELLRRVDTGTPDSILEARPC
ncbi:methyltransferase [Nocardia goodfellowii]